MIQLFPSSDLVAVVLIPDTSDPAKASEIASEMTYTLALASSTKQNSYLLTAKHLFKYLGPQGLLCEIENWG